MTHDSKALAGYCKGNILDTWTRVVITKYQLAIPEFPHPNFKNPDYVPNEDDFNSYICKSNYKGIQSNRNSFESILECKYYEMEDFLAGNNEGYFLINSHTTRYDVYFEIAEDAMFFKLTWC